MNERELAEAAKRKNILDMALTFTAMMRLFTEGLVSSVRGWWPQ